MIRRLGIRVRLVGGGVVIALIAATVAGFVMDDQIRHILLSGADASLADEIDPYVSAIHDGDGTRLLTPGPTQLIAVIDPDGTSQLSTLPPALAPEVDRLRRAPAQSRVVTTPDYAIRMEQVRASGGKVWRVIAARGRGPSLGVLAGIRTLLIIGFAILVVLVGVAAWVLTTASLTPVRRLRRTARRLRSEASTELLPVPPSRDDIADLATTLNELILDLRAAAERERRLVADASHELRTPIAILRAQVDLALAEPDVSPAVAERLAKVRAGSDRLTRLMASLLELSRIEADHRAHSATGTQLADEAALAIDRAQREGRQLDLTLNVGPAPREDVRYAIDPDDFGRIIDNLVNNASTAAAGRPTAVTVSLTNDARRFTLQVADDAGGMPTGFVDHAAKRFRRANADPATTGAGLGLSIVEAIAQKAGGTLRFRNRVGDGLTVVVEIPAEGVQTIVDQT